MPIIKVKNIKLPKYFPKTIAVFVVGVVIKNSMVPVNFSSENIFIVRSGIIKINKNSITLKTSRKLASLLSSIIMKKKIIPMLLMITGCSS